MPTIITLIIFLILSIPVIIISWRSLTNLKSHGFYRFFSWECIILLFAINYNQWFTDPFTVLHTISWLLLCISLYLITTGVIQLKRKGKRNGTRKQPELYAFEKTTALVDTGVYRYIRHPLYSSLLFLTWGISFKNINAFVVAVSLVSTLFLFLTAKQDEKNCLNYFGDPYRHYMKHTKRFIPFLF